MTQCKSDLRPQLCPRAQVRSIGKRDAAFLFQLGDELIMYAPLHELLAASVPAFLPINIAEVRNECMTVQPSRVRRIILVSGLRS